jgi:uncharacterized protein YdiU (UPF0061 family)
MDSYDPATVFSSIDQQGRYAYANQPGIAHWNLTRLAETLLPFLADDEERAIADAKDALEAFAPQFEAAYHKGLLRKFGLTGEREDDLPLVGELLNLMIENRADFTLTFRGLCDAMVETGAPDPVRNLFIDPTAYDRWASRWRERLASEPGDIATRQAATRAANPAFIPRNHRVEAVIEAAMQRDDYAPFEELLTVLSRPYDDQPNFARYAEAPEPDGRVYRTFCGT